MPLPNALATMRAIAIAGALGACAFSDVFKTAGPGEVRFVWIGDTVVTIGAATLLQIGLLIDGVPANAPAVRVAIPDTSVIAFDATQDSIVGRRPGYGDVVAWIESSLAARIDTVFRIRSRP